MNRVNYHYFVVGLVIIFLVCLSQPVRLFNYLCCFWLGHHYVIGSERNRPQPFNKELLPSLLSTLPQQHLQNDKQSGFALSNFNWGGCEKFFHVWISRPQFLTYLKPVYNCTCYMYIVVSVGLLDPQLCQKNRTRKYLQETLEFFQKNFSKTIMT